MAAIDLYSGIGGWTLGLKLAGIPVLSSYEWWKDANVTHNKNFMTDHKERDIRALGLNDLPNPRSIDFVVGSPPCTQFSMSNRGGKGDINDGLIDIRKFLEVVEHLQPKYWAMENVPSVVKVLEKELSKGGSLERFKYLFGDIKVYRASDFGVPQDRKRMIAGRFPFHLLDAYQALTPRLVLADVLHALEQDPVVDPIYGISLSREQLTDHLLEPSLTSEEERINRETKTHHPVYNMMGFPDNQNRPSRTITALCTRVSRESIIIRDCNDQLRRLTVRERGCLQSFPINYQYFGSTYASKIKMIGNAIPPLLTFYIAQAMKEVPVGSLTLPGQLQDRLVLGTDLAVSSIPDNQGSKYSWSRSFWLAINGLRFGSGVRFELKNRPNKVDKSVVWRINFFYGNSKNIKAKPLDQHLFKKAFEIVSVLDIEELLLELEGFKQFVKSVNEVDLQLNWTNKDRSLMGPIGLVDQIAMKVKVLNKIFKNNELEGNGLVRGFIESELRNHKGMIDNKKLIEYSTEVFIGMLLGSFFNCLLENKDVGTINILERLSA